MQSGLMHPSDVRSIQSIELPDIPGAFDWWGQPDRLELLLHDYFDVAVRTVRPLVRIYWQARRPTLMLTGLSAPLIVMGPTVVDSTPERRAISVVVEGGLLVKVASAARLTLSLERRPPVVSARVELVGYIPRGGHRRLVRWIYAASQERLHIWVGQRFLRELQHVWGNRQAQ